MRLLSMAFLTFVAAALTACETSPYRTAVVETRTPPSKPAPAPSSSQATVLRFSVAAIESPRDTYASYTRLFDRVGRLLDRTVQFEQRRTYREVNELLISGELDAALLCTGGYLDLQKRAPRAVEIVAVPVVAGGESYESVIVVSAASDIKDIGGLQGRRFAFTDELSFSGRLYPVRLLRDRGFDPDHFFGGITYTGSHDRSIHAVASGLVDGAAVHGGVLAELEARDPTLEQRLRVIHRSPPLGAMPVVVSTRLPPEARARLREVLLGLDRDPEAAATLKLLRFDRFAEPSPGLYASAARMLDGR
ncbi:substrate-binding domain-containing protein [Anaeromyxobacter oryzae]|uniref:substrate-binding domain-containing protein n=1 Tax=Anaeromyxobacter oryzae TaxID=2918170 RepID=UPI0020BDC43C|nr:phosphate/phosphite/phosphonate ABC transporter substrate-binding protein [Anaeromyxobacter oryzae]